MKAKITILVLAALLTFRCATAQLLTGSQASGKIAGAEKVLMSEKTDLPEYIKLRQGSGFPETDARLWIQKTFSYSSDLGIKILNTIPDESGVSHLRCQLTFSDIPVHDAIIILHSRNGIVYALNGKFPEDIKVSPNPGVNKEMAYAKAKTFLPASGYREGILYGKPFGLASAQLEFIRSTPSPVSDYRLAYRFDIYTQKPLAHQYVFVSADDGSYIRSLNLIQTHDRQGTAVTKYSGTQTIYVDSVSNQLPSARIHPGQRNRNI